MRMREPTAVGMYIRQRRNSRKQGGCQQAKSRKVRLAGASRNASFRIAAGASPESPKALEPFWEVSREGTEKTHSKSKRHFEKSKVSKKTKSQGVILLMRSGWYVSAMSASTALNLNGIHPLRGL